MFDFLKKDNFEKFDVLMLSYSIELYEETVTKVMAYAILPCQTHVISKAYQDKSRVALKMEDTTTMGLDFSNVSNFTIIPVYNMDDVKELVLQPNAKEKDKISIIGIRNDLESQVKKEMENE